MPAPRRSVGLSEAGVDEVPSADRADADAPARSPARWSTVRRSLPGRLLRRLGRSIIRIPLALAMAVLLWTVGLVTGSVSSGPPAPLGAAVSAGPDQLMGGQWLSMFTSVFFPGPFASYVLATAVVLGCVGLAEVTIGVGRTAVAFVVGHLGALLLYFAVVELGTAMGSEWLSTLRHPGPIGPFAGSLAAVLAASPRISALWRRRIRSVSIAVTVMLLLYIGHPQNLDSVLGVACGLGIGALIGGRHGSARYIRSTSREVRALLSMVVAVFAAGPVLASLAKAPSGPLAVLRNLIVNPIPTINDLQASCSAAVDLSCLQIIHSPGLRGPGGEALSLVPLVLLLVCAEGLRRGNRAALWVAISVHLVIGVLSAIYLQLFAQFGTSVRSGSRVLSVDSGIAEVLPVVLVPLLIAAALFAARRHFNVDADPVLGRRSLILLAGVFAVFVTGYVVAWFAEDNYHHRAGLLALLATLPRMFLPYPFSFRYSVSVYPHGVWSPLIFSYGGAVFWLVCLMSILAMFVSRKLRDLRADSGISLARRLVRQGGGSLSWMALWPNNRYWFNEAETVGVAYQLHYNVALTVGGPFGASADFERAVEGFTAFCAEQSLSPCWYSVTDEHWNLLRGLGFSRVRVAEETLLPLGNIEFKGKEWQGVRTALNKARRLSVEARWSTYGELSGPLRTQVHEISEEWVSEKTLPEMGFTLGGVEELKDENVLLCLAVDDAGKVHGVTSWLPVFTAGVVTSRTLDFMRRSPDGFKGVMEFLIASAVLHFDGTMEEISLSGSPLAPLPRGDPAREPSDGAAVGRFLDWLGGALEPAYGFRSLAAFKQRFHPRHRTLYMMYHDPLALPVIGRALTEAYMPTMSIRHTARLLRGVIG